MYLLYKLSHCVQCVKNHEELLVTRKGYVASESGWYPVGICLTCLGTGLTGMFMLSEGAADTLGFSSGGTELS